MHVFTYMWKLKYDLIEAQSRTRDWVQVVGKGIQREYIQDSKVQLDRRTKV